MHEHAILFATAARLAAMIRARELSPVEAMRTTPERARAPQGPLDPFAALLEERAIADAREAERPSPAERPLHGVPVSIKDQVDVAEPRPRAGARPAAARGAPAG